MLVGCVILFGVLILNLVGVYMSLSLLCVICWVSGVVFSGFVLYGLVFLC